ncbi:SIR2 family protein [Rhizorhabdus dicambivorans]|nr:SIR2 family protein [Rhizorhabdus dicambivorans]
MGANYLKKYYLHDHKLAQRARLEFFRSLATGRMIAFVGSMATQAFGYGGWEQLRMTVSALGADASRVLADDVMRGRIEKYERLSASSSWPVQVGMSIIEEALDEWREPLPEEFKRSVRADDWPLDQFETVREAVRVQLARRFREPRPHWRMQAPDANGAGFDDMLNVPFALWHALGIRRFATPSYDFEIERVAMLADRISDSGRGLSPFQTLVNLRNAANENFYWDLGSGRIRRVFSDGWAIESDLLNRERIDRMIEFAVGTDDVDGHVMHLHGRACNWRSMIVSQRDYDNLYRRNDLNRAPFEFAKRLMMGGNPILFVGLGMGEQELNSELQEFISNNPYQRVAPTFLLWSIKPKQLAPEAVEAMRVDFLRRLGVLTIFDSDFETVAGNPDGYVGQSRRYKRVSNGFAKNISMASLDRKARFKKADQSTGSDLAALRHCVALLAAGVAQGKNAFINPTVRERHIGSNWRSMEGRLRSAKGKPVVLWAEYAVDNPERWAIDDRMLDRLKRHLPTDNMICIIGAQGCGKGNMARATVASAVELGLEGKEDGILINGGFTFDTDTILDGLSRFLSDKFGVPMVDGEGVPLTSRQNFFTNLQLDQALANSGQPDALIVINGMERFFDTAGNPLSAELDQLLTLARGPRGAPRTSGTKRTYWVMFGTERVRKYVEKLGITVWDARDGVRPARLLQGADPAIPGCYFNSIWQGAKEQGIGMSPALRHAIDSYDANRSGRISGNLIDIRRTLFGILLDENILTTLLTKRGQNNPGIDTARNILKALAFIGLPVEEDVLRLMPALKAAGAGFSDALDALVEARLVLKLDGYRDAAAPGIEPVPRFALHRLLLTELRYRYGIPLSEAKLSTAFNMSLYVAQPTDGDIPDNDIHDELGDAIDRLISSYRHQQKNGLRKRARALGLTENAYRKLLGEVAMACGASEAAPKPLDIDLLCSARHARAIRTALALVRSYYSTTGLLTLDSGDRLIREGRDGVLLEHAERLDDLIDGYGKLSMAREALHAGLCSVLKAPRNSDTIRELIHEQFGPAEPFYPDELVWLHNERGVVRLAMGDVYEARSSFDQAMLVNREWVERDDRAHNWRRIRLNQLTVDIERGEIGVAERKCEELIDLSQNGQLREDKLATAIATGYLGWCRHLRGQADPALACYEEACGRLSELGEVRAQAYFERLRANAQGSALKPAAERRATLERALSLAQSGVQMDIVHRLQITLADTFLFDPEPTPPLQQKRAHRYLEEALTYAIHTDVHRVRCEASMVTARARLHMSDFEGALRYATDAMMIATRYGMELRKISLRALIAKIMAARGHPVTAEQLARTCIKMATRQRYQTAIHEAAQVITDIPRISAAISSSDASGRRNF